MRLFLVAFVHTWPGRLTLFVLAAMLCALGCWIAGLSWWFAPLVAATIAVGVPVILRVIRNALHGDFGADLLGMLALITSAWLGEWIVAAIIALMLSGGEALEEAASARASAVLNALAKRSPTTAHVLSNDGSTHDVNVGDVEVGQSLLLFGHEICPVDGIVLVGDGAMDESYLTGEPYVIRKSPGSAVLSGAINGEVTLTIRAEKLASDSRYAQIVSVLEKAEGERPPIRRLADRLGFVYTLIALALAILGWAISGEPERFLAVVVIATPCPLLIGVPVAVIGAISYAARCGIIVKSPTILEQLDTVQTVIFDKTGTLTYGAPKLVDTWTTGEFTAEDVLQLTASAERYSRHPLAGAILEAASGLALLPVDRIAERPGQGLTGEVAGRDVQITGRNAVKHLGLPPEAGGLECVVLVDGELAGVLQFRDAPRIGARDFIHHLGGRHRVVRTMLLSGDRESEVRYLAELVGVSEWHASVSPEGKLAMVREETAKAPTLFLGDGINDAPAMTAATAGVAFGRNNDVTAESADAVVLDSSLERLDDLLHISQRMRRIALQTAIGGIVLSGIGMVLAVFGLLPPILGAIGQEVIDLAAIANATRAAWSARQLSDFRNSTKP